MTWRLEPPHLSLLLPTRLVRVLGSIILVLASLMLSANTQFPVCSTITPQLICNDFSRSKPQSLEQFTEKSLRCLGVTTPLNQNIQNVAILVHSPPQVMLLAFDPNENLIKVPSVTRSTRPGLAPLGVLMAKTKTPLADRLVGDVDSPTHQYFFNIPEA